MPDGQWQTLGENIAGAKVYNDDVIRPRDNPLSTDGGLAVLRGNLAPDGAVIKPTAAEPHLLKHTGAAVVFKDYNDLAARIDDDELDIDENSVLVLQNAGPLGGPGMPEWGQLPIPKKLLEQGRARHGANFRCAHERHFLRRVRAARCARILHRRSAGVRARRRSDRARRRGAQARAESRATPNLRSAARRGSSPPPHYARGFGALYEKHITQADKGCDFDFLHAGAPTPDPEIH